MIVSRFLDCHHHHRFTSTKKSWISRLIHCLCFNFQFGKLNVIMRLLNSSFKIITTTSASTARAMETTINPDYSEKFSIYSYLFVNELFFAWERSGRSGMLDLFMHGRWRSLTLPGNVLIYKQVRNICMSDNITVFLVYSFSNGSFVTKCIFS